MWVRREFSTHKEEKKKAEKQEKREIKKRQAELKRDYTTDEQYKDIFLGEISIVRQELKEICPYFTEKQIDYMMKAHYDVLDFG